MAKHSKVAKKKLAPSAKKERVDKRKALLTYMKPHLIAEMKQAASDDGLKAWQFVERAVIKALKAKRRTDP